jgi:hypothetical protein
MTPRTALATRRRGPSPRVLGIALELALAASLVAALGVFHVWSRTRVLASGYALAELQQEHTRLVASRDQLEIELGMLTSFQALDQAARTKLSKLGLAPPDRGAVWAASPGRPPTDEPGRAGVDGVGHRPRPAGPIVGHSGDGKATGYRLQASGRGDERLVSGTGPETDRRDDAAGRSPAPVDDRSSSCSLEPEACSLALASGQER